MGLINIDISNMKVPKITVCIPEQENDCEEYKIVDINDVSKIVTECKCA